MISLHVISLEADRERHAFMQRQLEGLGIPFRFFNAVDGRKMTPAALEAAAPGGGVDYCGLLTPGEIGCALSHLAVIRMIAESEHQYGAVMEDDVFLMPEARKFLDEQFLRALPAFDIFQLGSKYARGPRLALSIGNIDGHEMRVLPRCSFSMCGLIYTREAARSITASIADISAPIDNMIFYDRRPFGLRVVELRPSVVRQNDELASAIGSRPRPKHLFTKLGREVRRFRNWTRRWRSFVRGWGLLSILRLRAT